MLCEMSDKKRRKDRRFAPGYLPSFGRIPSCILIGEEDIFLNFLLVLKRLLQDRTLRCHGCVSVSHSFLRYSKPFHSPRRSLRPCLYHLICLSIYDLRSVRHSLDIEGYTRVYQAIRSPRSSFWNRDLRLRISTRVEERWGDSSSYCSNGSG